MTRLLAHEAPAPVPVVSRGKAWNTDRLAMRFGVDVTSAAIAGALTCPVITVIDR